MARGGKKGALMGPNRRAVDQDYQEVYDEMFSQQTDTISAAIVEAYRNCKLQGSDEIDMGGELISQGRYWHGE